MVVLPWPFGRLEVNPLVDEHIPMLSCEAPSLRYSSSRLATVIVPPGAGYLSESLLHTALLHLPLVASQ